MEYTTSPDSFLFFFLIVVIAYLLGVIAGMSFDRSVKDE